MDVYELTAAPRAEDFTLLDEHQAQTPGTFFGGQPVLHLHCPAAELRTLKTDALDDDAPAVLKWMQTSDSDSVIAAGQEQSTTRVVDVWVTSKNIALFSPAEQRGVTIEYSTIAFHAKEGSAVLFGLNLSDDHTPDEDILSFYFRIVPSRIEKHSETGASAEVNGGTDYSLTLYDAVAACQELNPDPEQESDEDGGPAFDPTAPGATGWITSENMNDFLDENGQFSLPGNITVIGEEDTSTSNGEALGAGAGTVRSAADMNADGEQSEGADGEEVKRRRND